MKQFSVLLASTSMLMASGAGAEIPTADGVARASLAAQTIQMTKDAAIQAKQYALEIKGWVDVANTYATALQNSVAIPASAIAQVNALYYRAQGLANAATALTGPTGSMSQRVTMLKGIGAGAGGLPGDISYNADFWNEQLQRQWDDDAKLLGLEEERRQIESQFLTTASANSAAAIGQMQAIQAQGQITAAAAGQVQHTNMLLSQAQMDQKVKEALIDAQQRAYRDAQAADLREAERQAMTPASYAQSPIIWGR